MKVQCGPCGKERDAQCYTCGSRNTANPTDPAEAFAKRPRAWLDRERTIGQVTPEQAEIVDRLMLDLGVTS